MLGEVGSKDFIEKGAKFNFIDDGNVLLFTLKRLYYAKRKASALAKSERAVREQRKQEEQQQLLRAERHQKEQAQLQLQAQQHKQAPAQQSASLKKLKRRHDSGNALEIPIDIIGVDIVDVERVEVLRNEMRKKKKVDALDSHRLPDGGIIKGCSKGYKAAFTAISNDKKASEEILARKGNGLETLKGFSARPSTRRTPRSACRASWATTTSFCSCLRAWCSSTATCSWWSSGASTAS